MGGALSPFGLTEMEWAALQLSLWASSLAVLVSLPIALFFGWLLARRRFPGHALLNAFLHMPLVLPPVVMGYLLLVLLGRNGWIGGPLSDWFGIRIAFTSTAVVIASAVVSFPLMLRAIRQSAEAMDRRLEKAARSLGASETRIFFTVTLPLLSPGILTGMTLAFARAVGEFGATITLAANIPDRTQTLPLALYSVTQMPGADAAAARLCLLSILLAGAALLASEAMSRRIPWEVRA
ncbi:MAG: molybdate ABC transporter permease subunit [Pseudomonadota bacterium]